MKKFNNAEKFKVSDRGLHT